MTYICPNCQSELVLRSGKYGQFYGCSSFPNCRKIVPIPSIENYNSANQKKKSFTPNKYQKSIFESLQTSNNNIITRACAGSGKTTTLEQSIDYIDPKYSIKYLVFAKQNKIEAESKMPGRVDVSTTHSFGFSILRNNYQDEGQIKVWNSKNFSLAKDYVTPFVNRMDVKIGSKYSTIKYVASQADKILSLLKNNLLFPTEETIEAMAEYSMVDINPLSDYWELCVKAVEDIFFVGLANKRLIDYDDMLFLPWYLELPIPKTDFILADEIQDFNPAQLHLLFSSVGQRILGVGDENQSIYQWRGASKTSMADFEHQFNCINLPLSLTYRVPKTGVELINQKFPEIDFFCPDSAKEGQIKHTDIFDFMETVEDGALVLCRNNAPLVSPVYSLIKRGKKAGIIGVDIGKGFISWLERTNQNNLSLALTIIGNDVKQKIEYLESQKKESQVRNLKDKFETLLELSKGLSTVKEVVNRIGVIFTQELSGIRFSTIHRAKGLESDNVYILQPDLLSMNTSEERNVSYVAQTRFKEKMVFVSD